MAAALCLAAGIWLEGVNFAMASGMYAAEAAAPVFGGDAAAFAKQLSRVTEILGDHQDAAIAIERIKDLAAEDGITAPAAFGLGALLWVEHDSVASTRTDFSTLWPSTGGP